MKNGDDLTGMVFGRWTVISFKEKTKKGEKRWLCRCSCGKENTIYAASLIRGLSKSCGCMRDEMVREKRTKDRIGHRFGRLVVVSKVEKTSKKNPKWLCKCDCGNTAEVSASNLVTGHTTSCGCYAKEAVSKSKLKDLTGQVFGRWTVLERDLTKPEGRAFWSCECSCGARASVQSHSLIRGDSKSCGCLAREINSKVHLIDRVGQRFGRLLVIKRSEREDKRRVFWECLCDCGKTTEVDAGNLSSGKITSCGCYRNEFHVKHGMYKTPTYTSWSGMKTRCYRENFKHYANYGGRGIKVCDRWKDSFENFLEDMGEAPPKMTLDRIDNEGDYTPENCKWSTRKEQSKNRRVSKTYTYKGVVMDATELAKALDTPIDMLYYYLRRYGDEEGIRRCLARHGKAA